MDISSMLEVEVKEVKEAESKENVTPGAVVPSSACIPPTISQEESDFYKLLFGNDIASVRFRRLHCTACDIHIGSAPARACDMFEHPVLRTLLCAKCRQFYGDGTFEQGEDATDMFCRWCANGGNLYCCSYCSNTFCYKCIKRNFNSSVRRNIEADEKWKCFVCDPLDLYTSRAVCWALLQHVQTVTRILQNDKRMPFWEVQEKMHLDESLCCPRKRKRKRRKTGSNSEDDDDIFTPDVSTAAGAFVKRKPGISTIPPRIRVINGAAKRTQVHRPIMIKSNLTQSTSRTGYLPEVDRTSEVSSPCNTTASTAGSRVQSQVDTGTNTGKQDSIVVPPMVPYRSTMTINAVPTANLLQSVPKVPIFNSTFEMPALSSTSDQSSVGFHSSLPTMSASTLTSVSSSSSQRRSQPQQSNQQVQLYSPRFVRPPRFAQPPRHSQPHFQYHSQRHPNPLQRPSLPPRLVPTSSRGRLTYRGGKMPMVSIPNRSDGSQKRARFLLPKPQTLPNVTDTCTNVIEIDSDSDDVDNKLKSSSMFGRSYSKRRNGPDDFENDGTENRPENPIRLHGRQINKIFYNLKARLSILLSEDNTEKTIHTTTRRFHKAIRKTISKLVEVNSDVIREYNAYCKSTANEENQDKGNMNIVKSKKVQLPLEMKCVRDSASESEDSSDSDDTQQDFENLNKLIDNPTTIAFDSTEKVDQSTMCSPVPTADKSIQVYDVIARDYEKCIGHSVLKKTENSDNNEENEVSDNRIESTATTSGDNSEKYAEEYISFLQHIEDHGIQTEDTKGLLSPDEIPLQDMIKSFPGDSSTSFEYGNDGSEMAIDGLGSTYRLRRSTRSVVEKSYKARADSRNRSNKKRKGNQERPRIKEEESGKKDSQVKKEVLDKEDMELALRMQSRKLSTCDASEKPAGSEDECTIIE
ncbi:uncharacterized protein LOC107266748 [Cephus cinctus]|uniref:Uncharacterized protein LOC107266748 n=1 Tax=Cephus cinctus TaxID=211228 RepID=A0AAJ7FI65_CEPCN|nr:uncharacterized protein LOC107266748 [Cephus cinctus]